MYFDYLYVLSYVLITEDEYHRQTETKDRVIFITFPMVVLAIQESSSESISFIFYN